MTTTDLLRTLTTNLDRRLHDIGALTPSQNLVLEEGSRTNGRPWRLHVTHEGSTGLHSLAGHDSNLGWTKAEAEQTLRSIGWGLDLAALTTRDLYAADTGEHLGPATPEQTTASYDAGDTGIILISPDGTVIHQDSWMAQQPGTRRVYVR